MATVKRLFPNGVGIYHVLDSIVAITDGDWIPTHMYNSLTIHVSGLTTGTIQARGSNNFEIVEAGTLAITDDEIQLGADMTANGIYTLVKNESEDVLVVPAFTKIMCSAWTTGTVDVFMLGRP